MEKKLEVKNFTFPKEVRKFKKGKVELVEIGGALIGKATYEPGWKWTKHVKPLSKTEWCEARHFLYQLSGTLHVVLDNGTESDIQAGEVAMVPPGHDAWVVGDEPVVLIDFEGMVDYANKK